VRFFLIDRITMWDVGTAAEAIKNVALSEDFFDDHFPRRPVMPGVLMIEGMAQLAGLLLEATLTAKHGNSANGNSANSNNAKAVLTILERTKFRDMVRPGDTLLYRAEVMSVNSEGGKAALRASRDGRVIVTTAMVFAFKYIDDPLLDSRRASLLKLWMESV